MKTRKLGQTDLELTTIGLGTWAIGGSWQFGWGPQEESDSRKTIFEAIDAGINWIDTAPVYGCGQSEITLGRALQEVSQKPIIATKCGLVWSERREKVNCLDAKSIVSECEASLKRLGIDTIDLYQMHWPVPDSQIEEAYEAMVRCVEAGKVRYLGVSNFSVDQISRVRGIHRLASLQPPYSMINRGIEEEILEFCGQNDIGVVAYSPMGRGLLTGKFSHERLCQLAGDDHRLKSFDFQAPYFEATLELVESLKPIAEDNKITLAQLAICWVLRRQEVTSAIVGARRAGQISETAQAAQVELACGDIAEIENLLAERDEKIREKLGK